MKYPPRYQMGTEEPQPVPEMSAPPEYAQPSNAELMAELGYAPEDLQPYQEQEFQASPFEMFLERYGASGGPQMAGPPKSFAEGLLLGAGRGLAARGQQISQRRGKFEASERTRGAERNKLNLEATRAMRARSVAIGKEKQAKTEKQAEYDRDNPIVDDKLLQTDPWLVNLKGEPVSKAYIERMRAANAPETPIQKGTRERAEAAQRAMLDAQARAASAQERAAIQQMVNSIEQNPDIKNFVGRRQGFEQIMSAGDDGPGDLALIYGFVRLQDPNAVKEGEFRNVEDSQGKLRLYTNLPKNWLRGDRLDPTFRKQLIAQSTRQYNAMLPSYKRQQDVLEAQAEHFKIPRHLLPLDLGYSPPGAAESRTPPRSAPASTPTGRRRAAAFLDAEGF